MGKKDKDKTKTEAKKARQAKKQDKASSKRLKKELKDSGKLLIICCFCSNFFVFPFLYSSSITLFLSILSTSF